jgi:hypothetical protein
MVSKYKIITFINHDAKPNVMILMGINSIFNIGKTSVVSSAKIVPENSSVNIDPDTCTPGKNSLVNHRLTVENNIALIIFFIFLPILYYCT